jgi:hypothetical protein
MECGLSPAMAAIQLALIRVLDTMLKQVQRNNNLDSSELSLTNAFSRSFEHTVKQQLSPIWNTISLSTRVAVKDLRTVQDLLQYLLRFNCVSFLRYIQCLRTAAGATTEWLLHSAANTLFQVCTPALAPFYLVYKRTERTRILNARVCKPHGRLPLAPRSRGPPACCCLHLCWYGIERSPVLKHGH